MAGPSLVETLFQRSLDDVIKSLRAHPGGEPAQIARALEEIRREVRSPDAGTKSLALEKLCYLASLHGVEPSFAAFHALELLPSPSPVHKRLAYRAAALCLRSSDLLLLATNQLRKDLSPSAPDPLPSLALHFLSLAANPDLARDLSPDLAPLLASRRPAIRRRATAAAFGVLLRWPDSARVALRHLVDNLESPSDTRLVSAAISVFCELSTRDPAAYLPLAPEFHRILTESRDNWVLIKVLKIFARLAPLEPRLARRIVDPVCDHMRRSGALSLVLECVHTVATGLSDFDHAMRLSVDKIKELLASDDDPNLRYLGLHALSMLGPKHSWALEENRETILKSLTDLDPNIQREALHLIMGVVFESNVIEISKQLVNYAKKSDPEFCNEILDAVLTACGRNVYELVMDFDWYVSLLGEMTRNPHCARGEEIGRQLVDIGLRVKDARPELVCMSRDLLIDPALLGNPLLYRILCGAAWISGEYVEFSRKPVELVEALLQPRTSLLPSLVRAVYIQAVFKVLSFCFNSYIEQLEVSSLGNSVAMIDMESEDGGADRPTSETELSEKKNPLTRESIMYMMNLIETTTAPLSECGEVEVQERSRNVLGLIQMLKEIGIQDTDEEGLLKDSRVSEVVKLLQVIFSEELGPVAANSQGRVHVPDGLILEENLTGLAPVLGDDEIAPTSFSLRIHHHVEGKEELTPAVEPTSSLAEHRKRHGLYYLSAEKDETESNDYPLAKEPQLPVSHGDATEDLINLTEESLLPRKVKHTKPRPVVIKLDEDDDLPPTSTLKPVKDSDVDLLSGAVQVVLLGSEAESTSFQKKSSEVSSEKGLKYKSITSDSISQSKKNLNLGDTEHGKTSTRRSRHRHGKERRRSPQSNEDNEEKSHRNSTKYNHHHGRHKHRHTGEASLNMVPQTPVIQDFLL